MRASGHRKPASAGFRSGGDFQTSTTRAASLTISIFPTRLNIPANGWGWLSWWGLGFLPKYIQQYFFRTLLTPEKIIVLSPVKQMPAPNHSQPPRDHRSDIPIVSLGWDARTHIATRSQPRTNPNHGVPSTPCLGARPRGRVAPPTAAQRRSRPRVTSAARTRAAARRPRRRALAARGRRGEPRAPRAALAPPGPRSTPAGTAQRRSRRALREGAAPPTTTAPTTTAQWRSRPRVTSAARTRAAARQPRRRVHWPHADVEASRARPRAAAPDSPARLHAPTRVA